MAIVQQPLPAASISTEAQKLIDVTRQSFFEGIRFAKKGMRVPDISHAVQTYVESNGFCSCALLRRSRRRRAACMRSRKFRISEIPARGRGWCPA